MPSGKLPTKSAAGFSLEHLVAVDPAEKDLMTKCPPVSFLWISPYHYEKLQGALAKPEAAVRKSSAAPADYVLVSGSARADGSAAHLDPVLRVSASTGAPPSDPSGTHCLR